MRRLILGAANQKCFKTDSEPEKRKALLLLNPFGGAGAADKNWETKAKPLL